MLVEKPMAVSLDEARELVTAARNSSAYLVCAPFVTLSPTFQIIRERVEAGRYRKGLSGPSAIWLVRSGLVRLVLPPRKWPYC